MNTNTESPSSFIQDITEALTHQYKRHHVALPAAHLDMYFVDLLYTARIAAIVDLEKKHNWMLLPDDFNKIVNGRLKTKEAALLMEQLIKNGQENVATSDRRWKVGI